jgi:tripartite ATP-independent transporter DctM subunit
MLLVLGAFVTLVLAGMPVAFAIGISGTLFFAQHVELPFTIPIQLAVSQTQNFALLAVPLFILSGNFMNHAGITERLLRLSTALTGHLRGGLAQSSVALSTLMGGVSGSCIADAAMQARILGPEMLKRGYSTGYTAGILSFGSLITPIIPPGIGFILYGTVGQVSIGRLFAAGILPGLVLWIALAVAVSLTAKHRGYQPERRGWPSAREVGGAAWGGIWAILFPIILLVGLRFGIFTPSEIGAFAVVYSVGVGVAAYRELGWTKFRDGLDGSTVDVGAVMFLIALSGIFGYGIVWERVPELVSNTMLGLTANPYGVLILVVAFLLVAGCFVDGSVLIIMLTPIFLPVATELGFDPVHFGVIFIITATISNFTPPVGSAMYAVCSILDCPIGEYARESLPFLVTVSLVALLLIFLPGVVLFIPDLIFGK